MTCAHTCISYTGVDLGACVHRVCLPFVCERTACRRRCRYLEAEDEMERTYRLKQKDLARKVDVASASKVRGAGGGGSLVDYTALGIFVDPSYSICPTQFFELKLDTFGPYSVNYSRNGRCVLSVLHPCPTQLLCLPPTGSC